MEDSQAGLFLLKWKHAALSEGMSPSAHHEDFFLLADITVILCIILSLNLCMHVSCVVFLGETEQ